MEQEVAPPAGAWIETNFSNPRIPETVRRSPRGSVD